MFTPTTMSPTTRNSTLIGMERPVENAVSTNSVEGAPISQVCYSLVFPFNLKHSLQGPTENISTTTTAIPKSLSVYGIISRTHPSALYWKHSNACACVSSPDLHCQSIDRWEYTFNNSNIYDVCLLMAEAFMRVLHEIFGPPPIILKPKTLEALGIKYM